MRLFGPSGSSDGWSRTGGPARPAITDGGLPRQDRRTLSAGDSGTGNRPAIPIADSRRCNDVIATSTAVYAEEAVTIEERLAWFRLRRQQGYPVLVATDDSGVIGFISFGDFRAWPCYLHSVEHSVHVRADRRRHVGRALMESLIPRACALGKHILIAGIDADNAGSLRLHQSLGFEQVAHLREVGRKFDRWLDLVFMQRFLNAPGAPPSRPAL